MRQLLAAALILDAQALPAQAQQAAHEGAGRSVDTARLADGRLILEGNELCAGQVAALPLQDNKKSTIQTDAEVITP